jgi:hypothetical protein
MARIAPAQGISLFAVTPLPEARKIGRDLNGSLIGSQKV